MKRLTVYLVAALFLFVFWQVTMVSARVQVAAGAAHTVGLKTPFPSRPSGNIVMYNKDLPIYKTQKSLHTGRSSQRVSYKQPVHKPNEVLVKFKPSIGTSIVPSIVKAMNFQVVKYYEMLGIYLVRTPVGVSVEEAITQLKKNPSVKYAEPNHILPQDGLFPNDPEFASQWALHNTGQTGGTPDADIDAPEAWDITTGSSEVVIAVVDSGVDYTHEDLAGNMWVNPGEIPGDGIDNDGNSYIDDVHGIDTDTGSGDPIPNIKDDYGFHGTACAGIIAAVGNNGIGVSGICWTAKIMALKTEEPTDAGIIESINYMVMMKNEYGVNVRVSNHSHILSYSDILKDALEAARESNILIIGSAGNISVTNDYDDLGGYLDYNLYNLLNVISVAASDHNDELAEYSCYGYNSVDVVAPANDTLTTAPSDLYMMFNGTSAAAPHVTGLAGLICARFPSASYLEIKEKIVRTVDKKHNFEDTIASGGRINAYRALTESPQGPFIYSLAPGFVEYGMEIIIEGAQFGSSQGTGNVTFSHSYKASVISWSSNQIKCSVPEGCQSGPVTVTTNEGIQSNEKTVILNGSVSGTITDQQSGSGIEGVYVRFWDSKGQMINKSSWSSDTSGHYLHDSLPPGYYYARAENDQGYVNKWYGGANPEDDPPLPPPIYVESLKETPHIDFTLEMGGSFSGRIMDESTGNPIGGRVGIWVYDSNGSSIADGYGENDVNGYYTSRNLPTGDYYVRTFTYNEDYIDEWYNDADPERGDLPPVHVEALQNTPNVDFALAKVECTSDNDCEDGFFCNEEGGCEPQPVPCTISLEPATAEVKSGESITFSVVTTGDCSNSHYTWSVESMIGSTCDQNGTYTASMNSNFFNKVTDIVKLYQYNDYGAGYAEARVTVSSGCALLAIYGEGSEEVAVLRNFRDSVLSQTPEGQELIRFYYEWSPVIVKAMEEDEEFKAQIKEMIDGALELIKEAE